MLFEYKKSFIITLLYKCIALLDTEPVPANMSQKLWTLCVCFRRTSKIQSVNFALQPMYLRLSNLYGREYTHSCHNGFMSLPYSTPVRDKIAISCM